MKMKKFSLEGMHNEFIQTHTWGRVCYVADVSFRNLILLSNVNVEQRISEIIHKNIISFRFLVIMWHSTQLI